MSFTTMIFDLQSLCIKTVVANLEAILNNSAVFIVVLIFGCMFFPEPTQACHCDLVLGGKAHPTISEVNEPPSKAISAVLRPVPAQGITDDICAICLERPTRPVSTKFNHVFCNGCIRAALARWDTCPYCTYPLFGPPRERPAEYRTNWEFVLWLCLSSAALALATCLTFQPASLTGAGDATHLETLGRQFLALSMFAFAQVVVAASARICRILALQARVGSYACLRYALGLLPLASNDIFRTMLKCDGALVMLAWTVVL
ncbi:hypothetical protein LTR08_007639 [Meristemomyces frigidus]|nr:hypothetical protein LTR08_007639 [Meristemomyces frigidus]